MVIDHLGDYFFPDIQAFRAIGRAAMPLFMFLVGTTKNFKVTRELLAAALLVSAWEALWLQQAAFQNILWVIILTRLGLSWYE